MTISPPVAPVPAPRAAVRRAPLGLVGSTVDKHINRLQHGYLHDRSDAVAALARLRRGVGRSAGATPDLWGLTGTEPLYEAYESGKLTEEELRRADEAAHAAVTLWALHQQAHHNARMHRRYGPELGTALRRLHPGTDIDEPTRKRFVRAGTATTPAVLAGRLRDLVLLLRRDDIPLDYGLLADQLYGWQQPGGPQRIRRSWGRSYQFAHRTAATPDAADGPDDTDSTTPEDDTP
ncbi:type I-E CRISPR-associated protein Cse2/CasB [Streptomyces sp. NPDC092296]|uniref:type I-E CRISPR-associated protein Cse2/CasB n=1 Tax=Streptomyces sp. NPDC092296 TaxID=3366012 RepID=UPI00381C614B